MTLGLLDFFENSNQNGFGFLTVVVLFYLFFFFLIQFFQHKKLFYVLYSVYALINALNLMKYIEGVFFSDFFDTSVGKVFIRMYHYPSQLLGGLLFTYFIVEIMQLRKRFPKKIKLVDRGYSIIVPLYLLMWSIYAVDPKSYWIDHFHAYVFLPWGYMVFILLFYLVLKQTLEIKWYILSGMTILVVSYFVISIISMKNLSVNLNTLYIFYIGILMESLLFALAIGLEQKMLYDEKATVQRKYIEQLEENQAIKESINRTLSEELLQTRAVFDDISAVAQRERTEKLTVKLENRFSQLRLDALRSQMSPHFIFNALNSIKAYFIENNQEKAIFYLTKFSKLIRTILESSQKDQITLAQELETLEMYVAIESDRFKNNIDFQVEVDKTIDCGKIVVPALFLQPFVENAVWHGLSTKQGKKRLILGVGRTEDKKSIQITIEDNGVGRRETEKRNAENTFKKKSLGLVLTNDRLELFSKRSGKPYQYVICDLMDSDKDKSLGTRVIITLPEVFVTSLVHSKVT